MYIFNGTEILVENGSILLGMAPDIVLSKLKIEEDKLIKLGDETETAYINIDDVIMDGLSGKCRLLFMRNQLVTVTFTPTLKEYIKLLEKVTRPALYTCVDKGYQKLKNYLGNFAFECIEDNSRFCLYKKNEYRIKLAIGIDREAVSVKLEAIK